MGRLYPVMALLLTAALNAGGAIAQTVPPRIFGATVEPKVAPKSSDATTVKSRATRPQLAVLDAMARHYVATRETSPFIVDLFPGLDLQAEIVAAEIRDDGVTLFARLTELELGNAVFTVTSGVLTATVDFPGASFVVSPRADGHHDVAQKAAQLFPPERPPRVRFGAAQTTGTFNDPAPADTQTTGTFSDPAPADVPIDSGRLIDIMVVWTLAAQAGAGGLAAIQNLAQAAVDGANAAYLNSGVAHRLRLVHRQPVTYTERTTCPLGGDKFSCALDDVTDAGDNQLEEVHTLRDQHGADLVGLLISDGGACGIAWLPSAPASDLGFSVTAQGCAVGNRTFAHEVGHNLGAHHDPANADGSGPKPFNRGYVSATLDWRTMMSYSSACSGCVRLPYFSNPKLTHNGQPMGTANVSNNAHVLNFMSKGIAGYRLTSPLHPVPQRFTDVASDHPFFGHIEFLAQAGISSGCAVGQYCPDDALTRRQMAAFVERALRASNWTPPANVSTFTDVAPDSAFAGHIEAMRTDAITSGCGATTFCPEAPVTRGQMAAFILRGRCGGSYSPAMPSSKTFADVPLSYPHVAFIEKLYAMGITGGCAASPLRYCPDATVSRGEMAVFIERAHPFLSPSEACTL